MRCRGGKDFRERWGGNAVSEKEGILGPRERVVGTRMRCRGRKVSPGGGGEGRGVGKGRYPGRGGGVGYPVEATPLPPPPSPPHFLPFDPPSASAGPAWGPGAGARPASALWGVMGQGGGGDQGARRDDTRANNMPQTKVCPGLFYPYRASPLSPPRLAHSASESASEGD